MNEVSRRPPESIIDDPVVGLIYRFEMGPEDNLCKTPQPTVIPRQLLFPDEYDDDGNRIVPSQDKPASE